MKTFEKWEKSGMPLVEYLVEPCQIDEKLHYFLGECVAPKYLAKGLVQCGECENTDFAINNHYLFVGHYMTTSFVNGKYFYLGILPEFKR